MHFPHLSLNLNRSECHCYLLCFAPRELLSPKSIITFYWCHLVCAHNASIHMHVHACMCAFTYMHTSVYLFCMHSIMCQMLRLLEGSIKIRSQFLCCGFMLPRETGEAQSEILMLAFTLMLSISTEEVKKVEDRVACPVHALIKPCMYCISAQETNSQRWWKCCWSPTP